jgi:uncharacterized HAD superfamily protein
MGKYNMKKRKLGFDIDGTVTCPAAIVPFINEAFHLQLTLENLTDYDLLKVVDVPEKDFTDWYEKKEAEIFTFSPLAEGAKEALLKWGTDHELIFISARGENVLDVTKEWFISHGIRYDHIELIGSHEKVESVNKYGVEIFFEDKYENAIEIQEKCQIPVLLFDTPYNQGSLPNGVKRVFSWKEARNWVEEWLNC